MPLPGLTYTRGTTSGRYSYKLCISELDGRHNPARAGTYRKRVLDLVYSAFVLVYLFCYSREPVEWFSAIPLSLLYGYPMKRTVDRLPLLIDVKAR